MNLKPNLHKETDDYTWEQRFDICFTINESDFSEDSEKIKAFIRKYFVLKSELIKSDDFWRAKYTKLQNGKK